MDDQDDFMRVSRNHVDHLFLSLRIRHYLTGISQLLPLCIRAHGTLTVKSSWFLGLVQVQQ